MTSAADPSDLSNVSDAPAAATAEASGSHQSTSSASEQTLGQEYNPVNIIHLAAVGDEEPSAADLAAIEAEAPLIAAGLDLLDAEIRIATLGPSASALDHRRVRRAVRRVLTVSRTLSTNRELPEMPAGVGHETASDGAA